MGLYHLTASNEDQASSFRRQIDRRLELGQLPAATKYAVLPDPDGKRVGSGGATFNVLRYLAEQHPDEEHVFSEKRILVIHSGGDSKRVPQYSAEGKLFSPVPHELPDGRASTLFDEFMIAMSGVPSRMREGMLVLSGDVLLLFNPLQIDAQFSGAAAVSIKEPVETGKDHGVFLNDGNGYVKNFLHKQTEETLRTVGAVNEQGTVDLDTGAILMSADMLQALYGLISSNGKPDEEKFHNFTNEQARVSFYGDILYPLASDSTLEQYYKEQPEGSFTEELHQCRTQLWDVLRQYSLKLLCLSPAQFIHFGTTRELRQLVAEEIADYEFLNWSNQVVSTLNATNYATYQSYIGHRAMIGEHAYIEDSYVLDETKVGNGSILSGVKLRNIIVPENVVLHGLPLRNGKKVVRIYGVLDNPKGTLEQDARFLTTTLQKMVDIYNIPEEQLWMETAKDIWNANLYPVCDTLEEAVQWALTVYEIADGTANKETVEEWLACERTSYVPALTLRTWRKFSGGRENWNAESFAESSSTF